MKKKIFALCLVFAMVLGLAACGGSGDGGSSSIAGSQQTSGNISVFVPENMTLYDGSITSTAEDPDECYMKADETSMTEYIWISIQYSEDSAMTSINMTKEINNGEDLTITAGDVEWNGCGYTYTPLSGDPIDCGQVVATINDVAYLVTFATYGPESAELNAVLASITAAE